MHCLTTKKFSDFSKLLTKFQDFPGLFSNSRTFQDRREPWIPKPNLDDMIYFIPETDKPGLHTGNWKTFESQSNVNILLKIKFPTFPCCLLYFTPHNLTTSLKHLRKWYLSSVIPFEYKCLRTSLKINWKTYITT